MYVYQCNTDGQLANSSDSVADYTALISNSPRSLQESLFAVELFAYKRRLLYNPNKNVPIVFNKQ